MGNEAMNQVEFSGWFCGRFGLRLLIYVNVLVGDVCSKEGRRKWRRNG